ncbi:MAG: SCP2 sterol-binding domain-containing protein [Planctomycetota bacterium]|nr:SCP2 sterol-binding domain-containing protein [Planctomycetota bacterium]
MKYAFPSEEWVQAYKEALNNSDNYRDVASSWHHGAIAMVVEADPKNGLLDNFCVWLDVDGGRCRDARKVTLEEAYTAPYCLIATHERWIDVLSKRLDPIAGMVTRRIQLRGNLLTMMRYVRSAKAMVGCGASIPSRFLNDLSAGAKMEEKS